MNPEQQRDYWQPEGVDTGGDAGGQQSDTRANTPVNDQGADEQATPPQADPAQQIQQESPQVQWEASEYIHHEKGLWWFAALGVIAAALAALAFVFEIWTFAGLIIVMFVALVIYARRPPRTLHYSLTMHGFTIDGKAYSYSEFKAFGIQQDGAFYSIVLIPTKRFMPAVNMFFDEKDGEQIVDILGAHLPMQRMEPDLLDQIFRKLRF